MVCQATRRQGRWRIWRRGAPPAADMAGPVTANVEFGVYWHTPGVRLQYAPHAASHLVDHVTPFAHCGSYLNVPQMQSAHKRRIFQRIA